MRDYTAIAIAIAAAFALVGLLPLTGRHLIRPLLWVCLVAGIITGPIAREGTQLAWEGLSLFSGLANSPSGPTLYLLLTAAVGELVKATAPLAVISFTKTDVAAGIAYGAAAGAGFGFMATQQVLAMALGLVGSPIITPLSMVIAVVGWFFPLLAHIATTAYVARAGVRGGLGFAYLFAWFVQFSLGVAQKLPVVGGIPGGLLTTAAIALWLFGYLWVVRARAAAPAAGPSPAGP